MPRKRATTWRHDIETFKKDFVKMSAEDIADYRRAYWPGGSGMSNSVRCKIVALLEMAAEFHGIDLPENIFPEEVIDTEPTEKKAEKEMIESRRATDNFDKLKKSFGGDY
jgi:hypothetical protein